MTQLEERNLLGYWVVLEVSWMTSGNNKITTKGLVACVQGWERVVLPKDTNEEDGEFQYRKLNHIPDDVQNLCNEHGWAEEEGYEITWQRNLTNLAELTFRRD